MVAVSALPPLLQAAIPSIQWPLGPSSCPPLYFESLERLKSIRQQSPTIAQSPLAELVSDLPQSVESMLPKDGDRRHFGLVSIALILLGNGFTDECHNLVTPLSWPEDIHFAYGPSIYGQVSPSARSFATYVHCLVHRREAFHVGEFGMVGFSNANYWSSAVLSSDGVDSLPHRELRDRVLRLAASFGPSVQNWCESHIDNSQTPYFESRAVHQLCATVLRDNNAPELRDFAERVAETELRVLLAHALQKAGYDVEPNQIQETERIVADEHVALAAAKKVSSAHLGMFRSSGTITLRRVLENGDDAALSAAAGIACRLMGSPACCFPPPGSATNLLVALPTSEAQAAMLDDASGGALAPGDLVAKRINADQCPQQNGDNAWFTFVPCDPHDENAVFVDRLFGTRGETPTTVVQWSKGTIF